MCFHPIDLFLENVCFVRFFFPKAKPSLVSFIVWELDVGDNRHESPRKELLPRFFSPYSHIVCFPAKSLATFSISFNILFGLELRSERLAWSQPGSNILVLNVAGTTDSPFPSSSPFPWCCVTPVLLCLTLAAVRFIIYESAWDELPLTAIN